MHVEKLHSRHGCGREHRTCDSVRNIVEFQVQENAIAECGNLFHCFRPSAGKKLAADLEHANKVRDILGELQRRGQRIKVEGYNETAAGMSVEGHCFGDPRRSLGSAFLGTVSKL